MPGKPGCAFELFLDSKHKLILILLLLVVHSSFRSIMPLHVSSHIVSAVYAIGEKVSESDSVVSCRSDCLETHHIAISPGPLLGGPHDPRRRPFERGQASQPVDAQGGGRGLTGVPLGRQARYERACM